MTDVFTRLQSRQAIPRKDYFSLLDGFSKVGCGVTQIVVAIPAWVSCRSENESLAAHFMDDRLQPLLFTSDGQFRIGIANHELIEVADLFLKRVAQINLVVFRELDSRARVFHDGRSIV